MARAWAWPQRGAADAGACLRPALGAHHTQRAPARPPEAVHAAACVARAAHLELANVFALTEDIGAVGLEHEDSSLGLTMQRRTEATAQIVPPAAASTEPDSMVDAPSSAASAVSAGDSE